MAKHARKRQKTAQNNHHEPVSNKAARLELLLDEESKDDEERRLESMLFGVKFVPKGKGKEKMPATTDDEEEDLDDAEEEAGGRGMQHLLDQDLFFVDDNMPNIQSDVPKYSTSHSDSETSESEPGSDFESSSSTSSRKALPKSLTSSKSKPPAWIDTADIDSRARVSLLSGPTRLRKLRQAVDEDEITSREYETRLRSQFERINPEPAWARKARGKKARDSDDEEGGLEQEGPGVKDLLSSTTGILAEKKKKGTAPVVLPQGILAIERVRDANHSVQGSGSGEVRMLAFHPKPAVPVLCVATADRRIRLFNIDGHLSPLLTTIYTPSLPLISNTSVLFHPQGNSMLISGPRPFFYTYDLQQGTSTLHRRGLWGTGFEDSSILTSSNYTGGNAKRRRRGGDSTTGSGGKGGGGNTETVLHSAFSPATGSMLAVAGRGGNVHIVDWKSGAGQVVASLKCSSSGGGGGGGVQGLWWVPSSSSGENVLGGGSHASANDEKHLAVLTGEAEVYIWDVAQRRCVKRWKDEGGYRGAGRVFTVGGGSNGSMAIGSSSGFVNVYGSDSFSVPGDGTFSSGSEKPKLVKALGHLTTPISTLKFNHDAQILAMASKDKKDSMRLVHMPSLTAFSNWPTSSTPLGHVTAVDFSARSEYVAIGNTRGRVLLYHLKDYGTGGSSNGFFKS
ncbi:putative U3 small nucleolar RNA-associated protein 18 [Psilocybe cubensis]|uniref:WD40 repeat-like protein n=2 Tax=Psilocybe cubensis TaxID=181762 RepID=A0A8H7Y8M9_PSICU|nr:putative U3 small nucleolar RNA-associated protein 18 [Psilocybe cubensis]KAH9487370.1 putative U3 small nucleolar RNA-associated protein 18 [Psilocybe cubensis]